MHYLKGRNSIIHDGFALPKGEKVTQHYVQKKNKNKYTWVKKKKLADRWPDRLQGFTTS